MEYRVYNKDSKLVATISNILGKYKLISYTEKESELPVMLSKEILEVVGIEGFLKSRVLPDARLDVLEDLTGKDLRKRTFLDRIKLNSGRVLTDDFYILVYDNGRESKRATLNNGSKIQLVKGEVNVYDTDTCI